MANNKNPKVDAYLADVSKWREEMSLLRELLLRCGLTEEVKWGKPAYTAGGGLVAFIAPFKDYCMLSFAKGVLLANGAKVLAAQTRSAEFAEAPALKDAFERLTPGRQRAYALHFAQPKQSATRAARIEKPAAKILDGKGLND